MKNMTMGELRRTGVLLWFLALILARSCLPIVLVSMDSSSDIARIGLIFAIIFAMLGSWFISFSINHRKSKEWDDGLTRVPENAQAMDESDKFRQEEKEKHGLAQNKRT